MGRGRYNLSNSWPGPSIKIQGQRQKFLEVGSFCSWRLFHVLWSKFKSRLLLPTHVWTFIIRNNDVSLARGDLCCGTGKPDPNRKLWLSRVKTLKSATIKLNSHIFWAIFYWKPITLLVKPQILLFPTMSCLWWCQSTLPSPTPWCPCMLEARIMFCFFFIFF